MMENGVNGICTAGEPYDYRKYDRVWQRVAPSMSPWPADGMAAQGEPATAMCPVQNVLSEPGAQANPCCMGSAAMEAWEQPPPAPWNPRQHPQEGRTRPWPRRSALPGGGGGGRTRETRCPAEPASRFCGC